MLSTILQFGCNATSGSDCSSNASRSPNHNAINDHPLQLISRMWKRGKYRQQERQGNEWL
eukprot:7890697-Pyramimonas_sp.AAC.1